MVQAAGETRRKGAAAQGAEKGAGKHHETLARCLLLLRLFNL